MIGERMDLDISHPLYADHPRLLEILREPGRPREFAVTRALEGLPQSVTVAKRFSGPVLEYDRLKLKNRDQIRLRNVAKSLV